MRQSIRAAIHSNPAVLHFIQSAAPGGNPNCAAPIFHDGHRIVAAQAFLRGVSCESGGSQTIKAIARADPQIVLSIFVDCVNEIAKARLVHGFGDDFAIHKTGQSAVSSHPYPITSIVKENRPFPVWKPFVLSIERTAIFTLACNSFVARNPNVPSHILANSLQGIGDCVRSKIHRADVSLGAPPRRGGVGVRPRSPTAHRAGYPPRDWRWLPGCAA